MKADQTLVVESRRTADQVPGTHARAYADKPRSLMRATPAFWIAGQIALIAMLLLVYFRVRVLTAGSASEAIAHAHRILSLEKHWHIDLEARLQRLLAYSQPIETLGNWIYIWGHWPFIIAAMIWLGIRHRDAFRRLRDAMIISGGIGMVIFAAFPVAPPRLSNLGMIDTVTERSNAYRVLQAPALVNQYAAMPSLHVGWDLLVGIAIITATSISVIRILGYTMPALMATSVVLTANHYVLDVIMGICLVLVTHLLVCARESTRRNARPRS